MIVTKSLPEDKKQAMKEQAYLDALCQRIKEESGLDVSTKNQFINVNVPEDLVPPEAPK